MDTRRQTSGEDLAAIAGAMADVVEHRGPDDRGTWVDEDAGVAFGHRRLSIIDVSVAGHQPMASGDGRFVLTYNGELYNHRELRRALEGDGVRFRGQSDTEVLVEALARWGVADALRRTNGMFALATWDRRDRRLWLARDRMGEKPLYYGWAGRSFVFGSELKSLRAHPDCNPGIDRGSVVSFLRFNAVPAPHTIHEGISKLPAGTLLSLDPDGRITEPTPYWSIADAAAAGAADPLDSSPEEAVTMLGDLLADAVGLRMMADVPLGAFLSGGVDSSLVVALMQAQSAAPVRTFTIGFDEGDFDESAYAARVARHLGTEHTELRLTAEDVLAVIPKLPSMYDEPFADSSQLPTYLVSALARRHVTVSLSGDGGDELFAGYARYALFGAMWARIGRVPLPLRSAGARVVRSRSAPWWTRQAGRVERLLPPSARFSRPGDKLHRLARVVGHRDPVAAYRVLMSQWQEPAQLAPGAVEHASVLDDGGPPASTLQRQMRMLDQLQYLPDDILVKVDRASMAVSLETRVPLLDHRVVELAWRFPDGLLFHDGRGKWPLRRLLSRYVPDELVDRPKMGFAVPVGAWLRGPLRPWAEELLSRDRLARSGLDPAPILGVWHEHLARDEDWAGSNDLWTVLMLQAWLEAND